MDKESFEQVEASVQIRSKVQKGWEEGPGSSDHLGSFPITPSVLCGIKRRAQGYRLPGVWNTGIEDLLLCVLGGEGRKRKVHYLESQQVGVLGVERLWCGAREINSLASVN